jgi:uncharacterized protein (TIGR02996 family)
VDAIASLYRQVWEHPDDDHVRMVLADALVLAGDPRGELIQQQLRGDRAMTLLQRHGMTWLGALRHHVLPVKYERGFLASCVVVDGDACVGADEWSTVHTVELDRDSGTRFLTHPVMRSLRSLVGVTPRMWAQLPSLATLETIEMATRHIDQTTRGAARFPALVRIVGVAGPVALEKAADGRFSRLVGTAGTALYRLLEAIESDALVEIDARHVPIGERDELSALARRQVRLARFVLNGEVQT